MKTEAQIREHLIERAEADSAFRAELLADPKGTVKKEFGVHVPEGFDLLVHEDTATSAHLVLAPESGRLSAVEMSAVAGGSQDDWNTTEVNVGPAPGPDQPYSIQ